MPTDCSSFLQHACSLDFETNENGGVFALGAAFGDKAVLRKAPLNIKPLLAALDEFAAASAYDFNTCCQP